MKFIPLANRFIDGFQAIVDDADFDRFCGLKWKAEKQYNTFYAIRCVGDRNVRMHREILGAPCGMSVDHINGNGLDNRRENLRLCTDSQNQGNQRPRPNKFKGVSWRARDNAWSADCGGQYLGRFSSEIEAARAYDRAAYTRWGEFAWLNFPNDISLRHPPQVRPRGEPPVEIVLHSTGGLDGGLNSSQQVT